MKIVEVTARVFTYVTETMTDSDGHSHPGPAREARQALLTVTCDDGTAGHTIAPPSTVREDLLAEFVRPVLLGADPLRTEKLWYAPLQVAARQRRQAHRPGLVRGRARLVGPGRQGRWGSRCGSSWAAIATRILAYASTMCGDDLEGGLRTPEDYGRFAAWLVQERGYKAVKLHTWMPPIPGAPDVRLDYRACAAVREAVGTGRAADAGPQPLVLARRCALARAAAGGAGVPVDGGADGGGLAGLLPLAELQPHQAQRAGAREHGGQALDPRRVGRGRVPAT